MTTEELEQALEHDIAQKRLDQDADPLLLLARQCLQNAALAARGAECGLVACKPPALVEARQAAQLAVQSLEQALMLLGRMETPNV